MNTANDSNTIKVITVISVSNCLEIAQLAKNALPSYFEAKIKESNSGYGYVVYTEKPKKYLAEYNFTVKYDLSHMY